MKPILEHLPVDQEESFVVKSFEYPYYPTPWHFHPEYEIVLVTESSGKRFIGDNVANFHAGDLVFIGPNLPHLYRNDIEYYQPNAERRARSIVVHFLESSFGNGFLSLPETKNLRALFAKSQQGLDVLGTTRTLVAGKLHELSMLSGFARWLKLLEILQCLSASTDLKTISRSVVVGKNDGESDRMNTVFEFVMKNFTRDITLAEVAQKVNLAENSFSRYFSKRTRKSFISFVNDVRLHHACKLLQENTLSVSQICFQSGYNNLSNFNRQFKKVYGQSPLAYAKNFHR